MVISYFGGECFKITQGDLTLALNLPSKESNLPAGRQGKNSVKFGSDIVLVSQDTPDFNGVENASFGERQPFIINGPGEYEIKGVAVRGYPSTPFDSAQGKSLGTSGRECITTIYSVVLEGMTLCFLGPISNPVLPAGAMQELDAVDILFLPIGGGDVLDHRDAYKLAVQLGPKVVVPMHYDAPALKAFLKEAGVEGVQQQEKFTVKKKDLEGKEAEVVVLMG
ncbi:MAG: MBL fold metallo-hydrolase [bacterium]|nr:MBL fold metallo-hydrolase [bacterium]